MKTLTLNNRRTKLLKLKLLKTKTYNSKQNLDYLLLKNVETRLKKILHLIYKFHVTNKKILFIGTPLNLSYEIKQLLKNKKHDFIPESVWMNGIVTNFKASFKHLLRQHATSNENASKLLFNLKGQVDLIVILHEEFNMMALRESSMKRVPIIALNSNSESIIHLTTYRTSGNYIFNKKNIRNNLFFLLLKSLLIKAERLRKKKIPAQNKFGFNGRHVKMKFLQK